MNIKKLTLEQIQELRNLLNINSDIDPFIGKYCIVRTYTAGVFAGIIEKRFGKKILIKNCRRLWKWQTANNGISLSEVAVYGINQSESKICCEEEYKLVEDIEISPCTEISKKSIQSAKDYVA